MTKVKKIGGYIAVPEKSILASFKGEVADVPVNFPKGLGAEHPFDFHDMEKLQKKVGEINGIVNKLTDSIVTDFEIQVKDENSQAIIDDFIKETSFHRNVRDWVREALLKGNGFMELDLKDSKIRVMNANNMYVKRNNKSKILRYNQWTKPLKQFIKNSPDIVKFKPNEIAHLQINKIPNDPYGIGVIYPSERIIENLILNQQDLQKLITRKAGAPYHFKVGQPGVNVPKAVVDDVSAKLQYQTARTEWVTDGDIDIKSIDFVGLGNSLTEAQNYFFKVLLSGVEVPEVLMGSGQLNEGIAKVQFEAYNRRINSLRTEIADVIEEQIFRPLLKIHNLDQDIIFVWDLPGAEEIKERVMILKELLSNMNLDPALKAGLQIELVKLLELEDVEKFLPSPEEAKKQAEKEREELNKREREEEEAIPQPEVPGAKPAARQRTTVKIKENKGHTVKDWIGYNDFSPQVIKEIAGFNYVDYLLKIIEVLNVDDFTKLLAITKKDLANGLLSKNEVDKLRIILKDGFRQNMTIVEIEKRLKTEMNLKDRIVNDKVVIKATNRPNMIARTETVRLSNEGLKRIYIENNIEKVRFLAALSDRTCPICERLNGSIFEINKLIEGVNLPPIHVSCRCSIISIVE